MGHTVVLLAYTSTFDRESGILVNSTKKSAKRRVSDLLHAKDAAQKAATRLADKVRKKKARTEPIPEPAPITDTDVVDLERAARAAPDTKLAPSGVDHGREARASPATDPGPPIGSLVWPWDEGSQARIKPIPEPMLLVLPLLPLVHVQSFSEQVIRCPSCSR